MPEAEKRFPIGYVSRMTGLSVHVIRAWERRYATIVPQRSPANRRLYSPADIQRLDLLRRAVAGGRRISTAAKMSIRELEALVASEPRTRTATGRCRAGAIGTPDAGEHVKRCLSAVVDLEQDRLETALGAAAVDLPRLTFFNAVVSVLFRQIGRLWADGSLRIVNEHMASEVVQGFLWHMLHSTLPDVAAPAMVAATPAGQWCQIGTLMAGVVAADRGLKVHYLGPNLPAEEIAAAVRRKQARHAALGVAFRADRHHVMGELRKLIRLLPSDVHVAVGGNAAGDVCNGIESIDARWYPDLTSFAAALGIRENTT